MTADPTPPSINISQAGVVDVLRQLKQWDSSARGKHVNLFDPRKIDCLAPGLNAPLSIQVDGELGDFAFAICEQVDIQVHGNIGKFAGHSMVSGSIQVNGNVGDGFAAFAMGGFLATIGKAGNRVAMGLAGGEVIVRSDCGDEAGLGMSNGTLVLGNSTGVNLGLGMTGGVILVRGVAKSLAPEMREFRLKDADALRLGLLLARAGIRAVAKEFRLYRPIGVAE
jgi:methylamine---glutamate N-methyltransferase subunit B